MHQGPLSRLRASYGAKLALSLIGVMGVSVAYGLVVYSRVAELGTAGAEIRSGLIGMTLLTVIGLALIGVTVGSNTVISLRQLTVASTDALVRMSGEKDGPPGAIDRRSPEPAD